LIWLKMWQPLGVKVITLRAKALGRQLALAPIGTPTMLGRQRLLRLHVADDPIDLSTMGALP
jgi:hypothetical protein